MHTKPEEHGGVGSFDEDRSSGRQGLKNKWKKYQNYQSSIFNPLEHVVVKDKVETDAHYQF